MPSRTFLGKILTSLRKETEGKTSLIGFIGAPWTLAAYSVEGGHSKLCPNFKRMCLEDPALAHTFLGKYTDSLCVYASHQIDSGAQVLQIFESWAHHMSEDQFEVFAKPYVARIAQYLKQKHPNVPVVYFANGGSPYLHQQLELPVDALSIDWQIYAAASYARSWLTDTIDASTTPKYAIAGLDENSRGCFAWTLARGLMS